MNYDKFWHSWKWNAIKYGTQLLVQLLVHDNKSTCKNHSNQHWEASSSNSKGNDVPRLTYSEIFGESVFFKHSSIAAKRCIIQNQCIPSQELTIKPGFRNRVLGITPLKKQQKPTPYLIQFQFVMPILIKDFFMFTASNDQYVMNVQIFR